MDNNMQNNGMNNGMPNYGMPNNGMPNYGMPNGAPNMMYNKPKKNIDILGIIAISSSIVSLILAVLGTTLTCACSASKTWSKDNVVNWSLGKFHTMSAVFILSILAILFAIAGIVVAILALRKDRKSIMAKVALLTGAVAFIYAFIPMVTICSYNCSLNGAYKKLL